MQAYPTYIIQAGGPSETGVAVELRCELEAGGGVSGARTADAVAQVVAAALTAAGATVVSISKTSLATAPVSLS